MSVGSASSRYVVTCWQSGWGQYLLAVIAVVIMTLLALWLNLYLPHTSLLLLFMTGVVVVSAMTSLGPSSLSSLLSFISFNFFLTEPLYTLDIYHRSDLATLLLFLIVSLITGNLASRMRYALSANDKALRKLDSLYSFSQKMSSAASDKAVLEILQTAIIATLAQPALVISRPRENERALVVLTDEPPSGELIDDAWQRTGASTRDDEGRWLCLPVAFDESNQALVLTADIADKEQLETCETLCQLAGLALQRTRLVADLQDSRMISETEQLRSALLSSVSHDLRTPLASVIGASSSLIALHDKLDKDKQQVLLASILNESERLDRHIQNLLDMTRFGQGKVSLQRDWVDIQDIVSGALNRLSDTLQSLNVDIRLSLDDPIIHAHGLLIEQALVNVIDNAARFSPDTGTISLYLSQSDTSLIIDVSDQGPGIADDDKQRIFDMFFSLNQGDQHQAGTGLGLAIAQGMIGAHGGQIEALNAPSGGALIRISLPLLKHQNEPPE